MQKAGFIGLWHVSYFCFRLPYRRTCGFLHHPTPAISIVDSCPKKPVESSICHWGGTWRRRGNTQAQSPCTWTTPWILKQPGTSFLTSNLYNFVNGRRSGLSHTPEFPSWEGVLHPLPGNLLSFRLRSKCMDQKGRAVSETRTVLYSPFSSLF